VLPKGEEEEKVVLILYPDLRARFEQEWGSLSREMRSLAYFSGHQALLEKELKKLKGEELQPKPDPAPNPGPPPEIKTVQLHKTETVVNPPVNTKGSGDGVFDPRINKNHYHSGKEAEKLVRDALIRTYGRKNVKWVSGYSDEDRRDDTCGFDFKYRVDGQWKMLEVKNAVNDSFIISSKEVAIGLLNKGDYHIALVKNGQINLVKDFFLNEGWMKDFVVEGDYTAVPREWFVSFTLTAI
jgi:hypothetical protein